MGVSDNKFTKAVPAGGEQERVFGTVLFSDLCGSSELGGRIEPEELAEIVQQVKDVLSQSIEASAGLLVQVQGDGVLAVFGYPEPNENAPRNAINAALDAHQAFRATLDGETLNNVKDLRLHSSVHSGIFVVKPGNATDGRYALFGDTVNAASHLCDAAGPDEVIVSDITMNGVKQFFDARPCAPIVVKGRQDTMSAFIVERSVPDVTRFEARRAIGLTKFIGREKQLQALTRNMELARASETHAGSFRAVALVGEAGIGKTRLAKEFITQARLAGHYCAEGVCESAGACGPLQPVGHLILDLLQLSDVTNTPLTDEVIGEKLAAIDPELTSYQTQVRRILEFAGGRADSSLSMGEAVDVLCQLCLSISAKRLLILSVDDWQWIDDSSRRLLGKVVTSAAPGQILLVVTTREYVPDDLVLAHAECVEVDAFDFEHASATINSLTTIPPSGPAMRRIVERSGGNPLYLEEIGHLLSVGSFDKMIHDGEFTPSATVQELTKTRLARLDTQAMKMLQAASVIGSTVDLAMLRLIHPQTEMTEIEQLKQAGLLVAGASAETVRFKHGITRDVVYQSTDLKTRRRLHGLLAKALSEHVQSEGADGGAELLAHHYDGAGDYRNALLHAEIAGDRALSASSLDRTRTQFEACIRAMDHLRSSAELKQHFVEICNKFSVACVFGPARRHVKILERGIGYANDLGDVDRSAQLSRWAGYFEYVLGNQRDAIVFFEQAFRHAPHVKRRSFDAEIRANLGQAYAAACEYEAALTYLDEVADIGSPARTGANYPPVAVAYGLAARALVFADRGDFVGAANDIHTALHEHRGTGQVVEASIRNISATGELWRGNFEFVLTEARQAATIAERAGATYVLGCSTGLLGQALVLAGQIAEGVDNLRRAVALFERRDSLLFSSIYQGWFAQGLFAMGQIDEARKQCLKTLARGEMKDVFGTPTAHRVLASIAAKAHRPDFDTAFAHIKQAREAALRRNSRHELAATDLLDGILLMQVGEAESARPLLAACGDAFREMGMPMQEAAARAAIAVGT